MSAGSGEASAAAAARPDLSRAAERRVARELMGRIQWEMAAVGLGQATLWLANGGLVLAGVYPLGLGFVVALLCCCTAYLPSHEGQHGNLSGGRRDLRWLDGAIGHVSLLPLALSHEVLRATHMKHHAYTNDPDRDVDIHTSGERWWQPALRTHRGMPEAVLRWHAARDPAFAAALRRGIPVMKAYHLIGLVLVLFLPLETLLLWWLPRKIAMSYLAVFFSWYPHYPMTRTGRYRDTRFWRNAFPRFLCQSMQTHVVHHLYPGIPHWDEPKALEALRPFLIDRGVPGAEEIPERVRFSPLIAPSSR